MTQFAAAQKEAAAIFNSAEDKRLKLMMEMEERRIEGERKHEERRLEAERKHEQNMMRMMFTMMNPAQQMPMPYPTPQNHVMPMNVATHMHSNITNNSNMPTNITACTPMPSTDNDTITSMTTLLNMPHGSYYGE